MLGLQEHKFRRSKRLDRRRFWRENRDDSRWEAYGEVTLRIKNDIADVGFKGTLDIENIFFTGRVIVNDFLHGVTYELPGSTDLEGINMQLTEKVEQELSSPESKKRKSGQISQAERAA